MVAGSKLMLRRPAAVFGSENRTSSERKREPAYTPLREAVIDTIWFGTSPHVEGNPDPLGTTRVTEGNERLAHSLDPTGKNSHTFNPDARPVDYGSWTPGNVWGGQVGIASMSYERILTIHPPSAQQRAIGQGLRHFKPWNGEEVPDRMLADINVKPETLLHIPNGHRLSRDDLRRVRFVPPPGNFPVQWEGERPVSAILEPEAIHVG